MTGWNPEKVAAFKAGYEDFLKRVHIDSKDTGGGTILGGNTYYAQERFNDAVWDALSNDIHDIKCLKSRQLGISTACKPLVNFWMGVHDGIQGAMIFDTDAHKETARRDMEQMVRDLHEFYPSYQFPRIERSNRYGFLLSNRSFLHFMAAGVKSSRSSGVLGRSAGLSLVWASELCHAPGTPVLVENGVIKNIEDVVPGDLVLTHTGAQATVMAKITKKSPYPLIIVKPWLSPEIAVTNDHEIPTQRGKVRAGNLRKDDLLIMPVRSIIHAKSRDILPSAKIMIQGGGAVAAAAGSEIELNEEFGFAVGYYLSYGSITYQRRDAIYGEDPSGIIFTRHRDDGGYADRAAAAILPYTTGKITTTHGPNGLTTQEQFYGSEMASWVEANFGSRGKKHIPDEVFLWGIDFCRGLLCGLLCRDGSKSLDREGKYTRRRTRITTTRSSIATQARDLALSLGYGWGSIAHKGAEIWCGRVGKESWTVTWNGSAAAAIRVAMGLTQFVAKRPKEPKWKIIGNMLYVKIESISSGMIPIKSDVYDLSLDHPDHTFRTLSFSTSNCSWENEEGITSLRSSVSHIHPDRLYLYESTARGPNFWKTMWEEAKADDLNQATVFIGWWARLDQRLKRGTPQFERYGRMAPTDEESERIEKVEKLYGFRVDQEQLAWYRYFSDPTQKENTGAPDIQDGYIQQDQPWDEYEAFILTGSTFFDYRKLSDIHASTVSNKSQAFRFMPGGNFIGCEVHPAKTYRDIELRIWEEPQIEASYVIGADVAYGHSEKNDRSAIEVCKCYADGIEQVGEYISGSILPHQFAYLIWTLAGYYGARAGQPVMLIVELNGPGEAVWREIMVVRQQIQAGYLRKAANDRGIGDIFTNVRQYIYGRSDAMSSGHAWHWRTTQQLKVAIMERFRDFTHNGELILRSAELVEEMRVITRDGDSIQAEGKGKDDRAMAMALCCRAWEERMRRNLIALNKTRAAEKARRGLAMGDQMALFQQYHLKNFFQVKNAVRVVQAREAGRAAWRGARRY